MKKSKREVPSLDQWKQLRSGPSSVSGSRAQLQAALKELEKLRGTGRLGIEERKVIESSIVAVAKYYKRNQAVHDGTPTPTDTIAKIRKISACAAEMLDLVSDPDWAVESKLDPALKHHGEAGFKSAVSAVFSWKYAARDVLEDFEKRAARRYKRPHPGVILLAQCQRILEIAGVDVGLTKGGSPLVRFTRCVHKYATGLRVGSFDHHIDTLRRMKVSGANTFADAFRP